MSTITSLSDLYQDCLPSFKGSEHPMMLVGRKLELELLNNAYDGIKKQEIISQRIMIHGESGTGKTSLIMSFQEYVIQNKGFFCTGKHSSRGHDPYSAITTAFSDLCDLVTQSSSEDFFDERKKLEMAETLGNDVDQLVNAGVNISPLFNNVTPKYPTSQMLNKSAFEKFKVACKKFLGMIASNEHPVVLFLDDIQWMDKGTEELLKFLLQGTQIENFILILALRNEEEEIKRDFIQHVNFDIIIPLQNLDLHSITQMISKELGDESKEVRELSELISQKTDGNPFHIKQFISTIQKEGFLAKKNDKWQFDIEVIKAEIMIPDSLAYLLSCKVQRLNIELQKVLKIASLLGYSFSKDILLDVINEIGQRKDLNIKEISDIAAKETLDLYLKIAVDERFLERTSRGYQFNHDKIQAAFQHSMERNEREQLQLLIGNNLLNQPGDMFVYQAAFHLNCVTDSLIIERQERIKLAEINLRASKYCELKSAYTDSLLFLKKGIALLGPKKKWTTNFQLTFELTEALARMEFFLGDPVASKRANNEILLYAKSEEMKTRALLLEIELRVVEGELAEIMTAGRNVVNQLLNINLPQIITPINSLLKLHKVRRLLNKMTDEDILNLPFVVDYKFSIAIKVLMRMWLSSLMQKKYNYAIYVAILATELSLTNGLSPNAPHALYSLAGVEIAVSRGEKNFEKRALRLAELSLKVFQKKAFEDAECSVVSGLFANILFLRRPIRLGSDIYPKALEDGFKTGDIVSVSICATYLFWIKFCSGENLISLEKMIRHTYERMKELSQIVLLLPFKIHLQLLLNLRTNTESWEDLTLLTGEIMDEDSFKSYLSRQSIGSTNSSHLDFFLFSKMILAYTFGFYQLADTLRKKIIFNKDGYVISKTYLLLPFRFYGAMTLFERYRAEGNKRMLREARKILRYFSKQHLLGNPNATAFLKILEVEELSLRSKNINIMRNACDTSINFLVNEGLIHLQAIANEQAHRILRKLECFPYTTANKYLDIALHLYRDNWGATAKYRWLEDKYKCDSKRIGEKKGSHSRIITFEIDIPKFHRESSFS